MGEYTVREVLRRRSAETVRKLQQRRGLYHKEGEGLGFKGWLFLLALPLAPVLGYVGYVANEVTSAGVAVRNNQIQVFMRPLVLAPGAASGLAALRDELERLGYHAVAGEGEPGVGEFRATADAVILRTRGFAFPDGTEPSRLARVTFADGKVAAIDSSGAALPRLRLEPQPLGNIVVERGPERLPLTGDEIPDRVRRMLIAHLDPRFATRGMLDAAFDPSSILRRYAAIRLEATPRPWARAIDAPIYAAALAWEARPSILLDAYLNEVHLATEVGRDVHGVGLGASFLFGQPLFALEPHEHALLVAMAAADGALDPRADPDAARAARDAVLEHAAADDALLEQDAEAARARDLDVLPKAPTSTAFDTELLQIAQVEVMRDFTEPGATPPLGARVFTTLDPAAQLLARRTLLAARDRMAARGTGVEAAMVIADHTRNQVLAVVGGLGGNRGINQALDSVRPVGTLALPATYLTSVGAGYGPLTSVDDSPLEIELPDGKVLTPANPDGRFHGREPLVDALAGGHAVAMTRVALDAGIQTVVDDLRRLGVPRAVPQHPAAVAGEFMLSPLEVAQLYSTILRGGSLSPLHSVVTVVDHDGTKLARRNALGTSRSVSDRDAYLLLRALQHAARTGPGRSALGGRGDAAALVGASSGLRDGWAAGGDGTNVAAVWFGRVDDQPLGPPGIAAAAEALGGVLGGLGGAPLAAARPEGVAEVWVDPVVGIAVGAGCRGAVLLAFPEKLAPAPTTECRGGAAAALQRLLGPR